MNENNNNNFTNIQNNPEIETLDAPVQQTFSQGNNQNLDTGMNSLNNLSSNQNATSVSSQLKKNAKKTPFLIIAAVMIFCLLAGGTGVVVKTQIFDKAPNEIEVPGSTSNDKEDKNDKDELEEGTVNIEQLPNDELVYIQIGDSQVPVDPSEAANAGKTSSTYTTIEEAITSEENYVASTQKEVHEFDTYSGAKTFRFSNTGTVYLLEKIGQDTIISSLVDENNWYLKTEVLRRTYEPLVYTTTSGQTVVEYAEPIAYHSQNFLMLKIVRGLDRGYYIILNNQMQVVFEGPFYEQSVPKATDTAFYIGTMNCTGKLSNGKTGPVFEIFKFDTKNGETTYEYNIDYTGEENLCM